MYWLFRSKASDCGARTPGFDSREGFFSVFFSVVVVFLLFVHNKHNYVNLIGILNNLNNFDRL